ncbi:MAG: 4Fe-4S binding protein [Muribaculaceae bacterium]|nr:4Fe-4S binding protein [Muribaculaceae bacterium]
MRSFRIMLALVMLFASLLWLLLGTNAPVYAVISQHAQIIPSAIQASLGATVVWIVATMLFGRIYCATVCPVGTIQDIAIWIRRKVNPKKKFRFEEGNKFRYAVLVAYLGSLIVGILAVGYVIEPWNIMRNAASLVRPDDTAMTWGAIGISLAIGGAAGITAIVAILIWAWLGGRNFCTALCPIGTALGCMHSQALMHIAIDPDKCISCMKCEDICSAKCIKVEQRIVDNSRCIRCFDCTAVCPNDAIRFQLNKDRHRRTPLLEPNA